MLRRMNVRACHCAQNSRGFCLTFSVFTCRNRISHNASASLNEGNIVLDNGSSDRDGSV
jgi:hypothetical protein